MFQQLYKTTFIFLFLSLFFNGVRSQTLPEITAQAWLIANEYGEVIEGIHTDEIRSIASITKLMTVMVTIDSKVSLTDVLQKPLYNKKVNRYDLIYMSLIKSDNSAAKMLCETYPGGYNECINAMNQKAYQLGMNNTTFVDPTGIYNANLSTAQDLVKMVMAARDYEIIKDASNTDKIIWDTTKKKKIYFNNTNNLVGSGINFLVSKTGWIRASGGCIVMMLETVKGVRTVILLGSKNTRTRVPEAYLLSTLY